MHVRTIKGSQRKINYLLKHLIKPRRQSLQAALSAVLSEYFDKEDCLKVTKSVASNTTHLLSLFDVSLSSFIHEHVLT
jgi:hypothetical protein